MEPWAQVSRALPLDPVRVWFSEDARAYRALETIGSRAGSLPLAVPLLEALVSTLTEAADPQLALLNFERWTAALPSPAATFRLLREHPRLLSDLICLMGASQYLADILIRDPWLYSLFTESPSPRSAADFTTSIQRTLRTVTRAESRTDSLRRIKRREFLRIGWRDACRGASLEETVAEISDLADALVQAALLLAREKAAARFPSAAQEVKLAVMGLGKLGARELNYSSDIDLVFVMDSDDPQDEVHRRYATRVAEILIQELGAETGEGRCFRVDLRLRPEGRSGALVRSFGAFRTYYDRWAETWERQALIKVRPVAGDFDLGERFVALARAVTYRRFQGAALLEDVREMRGAVERKLESSGGLEGHVKEGRGTIREVEFPLQLLQLLFGADLPGIQRRDTLSALEALRQHDLLSPDEATSLEAGYRFFRIVEHRLQLLNDLPIRRLPSDPRELLCLARSVANPLGRSADSRDENSTFQTTDEFNAVRRDLSERVHAVAEAIYSRLGSSSGDALREALLTVDTPAGAGVLGNELRSRGFPNPEVCLDALVRLGAGSPQARHATPIRRLFADLAPGLLDAGLRAADPSRALVGMADLAEIKLLYRAHFQTLLEHPGSLEALARVAGSAPAAWSTVLRFPQLSEIITDEELLDRRRSREELDLDLRDRLAAAPEYDRGLSVLRRFKLREWVRMSARHVLFPVATEVETEEWSDLAEVLVEAALSLSLSHLRSQGKWAHPDAAGLAVLALGRFGGRDLHFASDLDLLYLYDPAEGAGAAECELATRTFGDAVGRITEEGRLFDLDLRLRPEGRQGAQVVSAEGLQRYYGPLGRAQTWELQALTRARPAAGNRQVAAKLLDRLHERVYGLDDAQGIREEIQSMRHRIERERVGESVRGRHLKLDPGGLADIEFLVQFLQLCRGGSHPELRTTSTLAALELLELHSAAEGVSFAELREAFQFLTRLRQNLFLLDADEGPDVLPLPSQLPGTALAAARSMGFADATQLEVAFRHRRIRVRAAYEAVLGRA